MTSTSGNTQKRKQYWRDIKHELQIHADAEERAFYSPLIDNDMMQEHARHGIAEHHEMDELIEKRCNRDGFFSLANLRQTIM